MPFTGPQTSKTHAAYRQKHEGDFLRADAAVRFYNEHGIAKLPSQKVLTAEIDALLKEKNASYTKYQKNKQRASDLLTVKRNIEQVLYGAPSQRRETER